MRKEGFASKLSSVTRAIKEFSGRYPAVLSGYIIYSYLFVSMMRLSRQITFFDIYETFDALPFMWLLATSLVKIIDVRTRLHNVERERMRDLRELDIKQAQLRTMHEVAKGFQHKINNPLAIISLALTRTRRATMGGPVILEGMTLIEEAASRISQAVIDFSGAQRYEVEHLGGGVGSIANPAPPRSLRPDPVRPARSVPSTLPQ
jgi:hypothetical protein